MPNDFDSLRIAVLRELMAVQTEMQSVGLRLNKLIGEMSAGDEDRRAICALIDETGKDLTRLNERFRDLTEQFKMLE
jgi:hypothetical protein